MQSVSSSATDNEISPDVKKRLLDKDFIKKVQNEISLLSPVCEYIDNVQRTDCTLAESVEHWIQIEIPNDFQEAKKKRDRQVLDTPSLVSNTLHPQFRGQRLNISQQAEVEACLQQKLGIEGFQEFLDFKDQKGNFSSALVFALPPDLFWSTIGNYPRCEKLSSLALLYTSLPSSTALLERIFSMWAYVHDKSRNRLDRVRSRKMLFIYHALRNSSTK